MGKGKIAAQVAHGETYYMAAQSHKDEHFTEWIAMGLMKKIILKASENEILSLADTLVEQGTWVYGVHDIGLTQIPPNSLTCLVTPPLDQKQREIFKHLKLL